MLHGRMRQMEQSTLTVQCAAESSPAPPYLLSQSQGRPNHIDFVSRTCSQLRHVSSLLTERVLLCS